MMWIVSWLCQIFIHFCIYYSQTSVPRARNWISRTLWMAQTNLKVPSIKKKNGNITHHALCCLVLQSYFSLYGIFFSVTKVFNDKHKTLSEKPYNLNIIVRNYK